MKATFAVVACLALANVHPVATAATQRTSAALAPLIAVPLTAPSAPMRNDQTNDAPDGTPTAHAASGARAATT